LTKLSEKVIDALLVYLFSIAAREAGSGSENLGAIGSGSGSTLFITAPALASKYEKRLQSRRQVFVFFASIHLNCDFSTYID
jgi:hypothetical protein